MDPTFQAIFSSWSFDAWIVIPIVLSTLVYLRGWRILRRRGSRHFRGWRLTAFVSGMVGLLIALLSPIDTFSAMLLQMHMIQHLLLMFLLPVVIWLSAPELPLLFGLPRSIRRQWVFPLYRLKSLRACFRFLTQPPIAWGVYVGVTWLWHLPRFYDAALKSGTLHNLEHASFFWAAMLFWWPVIQPYPSRLHYSRWLLLPYLFLAALQGTVLSGILSFSNGVLYDHYKAIPQIWGITAINDQAIAGTLMWVVGMLSYVIAAALIGYALLFSRRAAGQHAPAMFEVAETTVVSHRPSSGRKTATPNWGVSAKPRIAASPAQQTIARSADRPNLRHNLPILHNQATTDSHRVVHDVLQIPVVGTFLRWRKSRPVMQFAMFAAAVVVIVDGLCGTQVASLNLAGVLPWIHWRGFLVLGLLVAGNVFCMACPFQLSRTLGKKWFGGNRRWPRPLRSKWLAVVLLILFFWSYEAFSLWQSPWWTAWIAIGYFFAAFVIDGFFRGAAFCKYVCPIGQFNFVQSVMSPLEVRVRDESICGRCATKECIRGTAHDGNASAIPGCELNLFQPRKSSNVDCTFCLDCVHACPHQNVGILATVPGKELMHDSRRSGIGQFGRRPDLAALVLILVFAAFVNAAGMVAPIVQLTETLTARWEFSSRVPVVTGGYLLGLLILPTALVSVAAASGHRWSKDSDRVLDFATRFSYMLIPIGFAMWLAHYSFHLFASTGAFTAAFGRFLHEFGFSGAEAAAWTCSCGSVAAGWLLKTELLMLDVGLVVSLHIGYRIARSRYSEMQYALGAFLPWATLALLLFLTGVWIVFQPMQMRGAMPMEM